MTAGTLKSQAKKLGQEAKLAKNGSARRRRTRLDLLPWCEKYIQIRGESFSLEGHEYLDEIYREPHPWEIYRKAAQVGISTKVLLEGLWVCDKFNAKVLYYLSTDADAYDFSNDRVGPIIDDSNYLAQLMGSRERARENVGLRHVGKGSFYCRGMFTKRKVKSVDADFLSLDELDEADQENKRFAHDRLLHSKLQIVRALSQPSIPDYGVDEDFQRTDQRYYHHKCPSCGKYTCLDLDHIEEQGRIIPRHILEVPQKLKGGAFPADQQFYRACSHCKKPLVMSVAEWIPQHQNREERRGYHISQLYRQQPVVGFADPADWIMDQLMGAKKTAEKMRATISILGLPYAGDRAPMTDAVLDRAEMEGLGFQQEMKGSYIGIDQGDELHIVVLSDSGLTGKPQVIHIEQTDDWNRIPKLIEQFGARAVVGDAMPNKAKMKEVARATPSSIPFFIQYFAGDTEKEGEEGEDEKAVRKISVDRTESLDETTAVIVNRDLHLIDHSILSPTDLRTWEDFRAHLKMLVKDIVEDTKGVKKWKYKTNVTNHYGMALNSARIARGLAPITGGTLAVLNDVY